MNISEIENKELRELAELRRKQHLEKNPSRESEDDLVRSFTWEDTKEKHDFWNLVNKGEITSLTPKSEPDGLCEAKAAIGDGANERAGIIKHYGGFNEDSYNSALGHVFGKREDGTIINPHFKNDDQVMALCAAYSAFDNANQKPDLGAIKEVNDALLKSFGNPNERESLINIAREFKDSFANTYKGLWAIIKNDEDEGRD